MITPAFMLRDRIADRVLEMSDHIDMYEDGADFLLLSCHQLGCARHSQQVKIKDVPRVFWPDLLAHAAKGWGVDAAGDFICDACEKAKL